jgi:hypothetical protein
LEKRSKKLFLNWVVLVSPPLAQFKQVFAPLFSKSGPFSPKETYEHASRFFG